MDAEHGEFAAAGSDAEWHPSRAEGSTLSPRHTLSRVRTRTTDHAGVDDPDTLHHHQQPLQDTASMEGPGAALPQQLWPGEPKPYRRSSSSVSATPASTHPGDWQAFGSVASILGGSTPRVSRARSKSSGEGLPFAVAVNEELRRWKVRVGVAAFILLALCLATSPHTKGPVSHFSRVFQDSRNPTIIVTGGTGYIGSHTSLLLLQEGYRVVIVDNLANSKAAVVGQLRQLAGPGAEGRLTFHLVDLMDEGRLDEVFRRSGRVVAVVHFAGFKAVGESVALPMHYYENNLISTMRLVAVMHRYGCHSLVFSSSATVYGQPQNVPCDESSALQPTNPYGRTKLYIEEMLRDLHQSDSSWRIVLLRYFNPVGAHPSGLIGEDPQGTPNNLMPFMTEVALGLRKELRVFGNDYLTPDGTGVRDYIHVMDLAAGHIAAVRKLNSTDGQGCRTYNLGTGRGTSVLELHRELEAASGKKLPLLFVNRRPGDAAEIYAQTEKAKVELGWTATRGVKEMCEDQWRWASETLANLHQKKALGGSWRIFGGRGIDDEADEPAAYSYDLLAY